MLFAVEGWRLGCRNGSIPYMQEILESIRKIVGTPYVLTGADRHRKSPEWDTHQPCNAMAIVTPASTTEIAEIMRLCNAHQQVVVPYGGLTNLVQGCVTTPNDIALSFERMNRIEEIDPIGRTMTAQAGVTMQQAQERAAAEKLFFPVDIGARGTCMVGGNVSTNAGGTKVIRYGMIRDSVLGLEVVLADGTILDSMNRFLKNNSGFDLKQIFIGTEGVLGLITRIVFRLGTLPTTHSVAMLACANYENVVSVLNKVQHSLGNNLCGFEVMWDTFVHNVVQPKGKLRSPISPNYPFYVIVESMGTRHETDNDVFESALVEVMEDGLVEEGAIAKSDAERDAIWAIRHEVEWVVKDAFVFDVSLPVDAANEYVDTVTEGIRSEVADAQIVSFGHLADNNIHISVLTAARSDENAKIIQEHIYSSLKPYRGAISAEHGIGLEKRDWLTISRTEEEVSLMRILKHSLDPKSILNPGKVITIE